ncbi:MAG: hypothetical protein ACKPKO_24025 [Candidatus Fonsibacter sp.]
MASPGTDFNNSCVSIGGYLVDGAKQSNLTVDNYNRRVGIGTTTPTTTLEVNGGITTKHKFIMQRNHNIIVYQVGRRRNPILDG